jgi:hypothetical protein
MKDKAPDIKDGYDFVEPEPDPDLKALMRPIDTKVRDPFIARQVATLASFGLSMGSTAIACNITFDTLKKFYREDYNQGAVFQQKRIAALAMEAAESGSVPMIMFLAKTKLGWVESSTVEHVGEVRAVVSNKPLTKEEFAARYLEVSADKKEEDDG